MFGALRDGLAGCGVQEVLVACPSCFRVWKDYGSPLRVKSIYEQMASMGPVRTVQRKSPITVHDPCPTRYEAAVQVAVRRLLQAMGFTLEEMKHHGRKTLCCGEGGAACYIAPDFAGNWTETRASEAEERNMITYCAGCTHFLGRLAPAGHIADLYFEPERTLAGKVPISRSPFTWLQRLLLKRSLQGRKGFARKGERGAGGRIQFTS
jgi:hypothetical protein